MPFTYLPERTYLTITDDCQIELICDGEMLFSFTPEEARSNAADLLEAAEEAERRRKKAT